MTRKDFEAVAFLTVIGVAFAGAAWHAQTFPMRARVFPQFVAILGFIFSVVSVGRIAVAVRLGASLPGQDGGGTLTEQAKLLRPFFLWIAGYYVAIFLAGFIAASAIFLIAFLTVNRALRWPAAVASTTVVVVFLLFLGNMMNVVWPTGILSVWVGGLLFSL